MAGKIKEGKILKNRNGVFSHPMRLKQVNIFGFKSFADKTQVQFHEGITAIVGPNGCGKSNINDAIQWVLGEQSIKALRGGKMPDVIFAGTASRKPMHYAEVSITFDQIRGMLDVPFDEITITRRLHRNGDSEYLINNKVVRLKDIQGLFFDSGIGKRNFSTFQQREIDDIIQRPPKERRLIFEEAAEISRFLHTRKETYRRFEEVKTNVERIRSVKDEVAKRAVQLEEQSVQALKYRESKERLDYLEKAVLKLRHEGYTKKFKDLKAKEAKEKTQTEESSSAHALLIQECARLQVSVENAEKAYADLRESYLAKKGEKELKEHKFQDLKRRLEELSAFMKEKQQEISDTEEKRKAWKDEIAKLTTEAEAAAKSREGALTKKQKAEEAFNALDREIAALRTKQASLQQARLEAVKKEAQVEADLGRERMRLENHQDKKNQLEERHASLKQLLKDKEKECEDKRAVSEAAQKAADTAQEKLKTFNLAMQGIQSDLELSRQKASVLHKRVLEISARKKALEQLQQEGEGLSAGGKKLLHHSHQAKSPIYGLLKPLVEWIDTSSHPQLKLQAVLKKYQDTLVVEDEQDLQLVVAEAQKLTIQEYSLLCLSDLTLKNSQDVTRHFFEAVSSSSSFEEAITQATDVWIDPCCLIDKKKVRFFVGEEKGSLFSRDAEIRTLQKSLDEHQEQENAEQERLKDLEERKTEAQKNLQLVDQEVRQAEMRKMEDGFTHKRAAQERDKLNLEMTQVNQEVQSLAATAKSLQDRIAQAQKELAAAQKTAEEVVLAFSGLEESSHLKLESYSQLKAALEEASRYFHDEDDRSKKAGHALGILRFKFDESGQLVDKWAKEMERARKQSADLDALEKEGQISQEKETSLQEILADVDKAQAQVKQAKITLQERQKRTDEVGSTHKQSEAAMHQIGIQLAHVETGISSLERELAERHNLTFEGIEQPEETQEAAERQLKQIKHFIENCPAVNLAAIEESKVEKERAEFYENQLNDLCGSQEELQQLIQNIEGECREAFKTTFEQVRLHFQKNFEVLFRGGQADLELVDSEDPLEAGIEISAKPPGKQMRSLSLLSGGEKCLTAMALLFAIFEVKSSPFCLLDEIDAPLDDSNVERFVSMVRQYTDRCQFIIVTHNKQTMAIADRIYGVSMQEKGVSKLLSIEFSREEQLKRVETL